MRAIRRHLLPLAVATVGAQVLLLALGLAYVCGGVEHTHGGQSASDCPMHHQQGAPESTAHHHHHPDTESSSDGSRITCGCPGDILAMLSGTIGIMAVGLDPSPAINFVAVRSANPRSLIDVALVPLAPPPRT